MTDIEIPIDCEQLSGRQRHICRGYDDGNRPVLTPGKRAAYLRLWGYSEQQINDHLGNFPKTPPKTRRGNPPPQNTGGGVGTELKTILSQGYGVKSSGTCGCNARAAEMDRRGIAWCETHLDTCVEWLMDGAAERKWLRPVVALLSGPAERIARKLIEEAIAAAKRVEKLPEAVNGIYPPVEPMEFIEPVRRNFMMHIWPKHPAAWRWNCDQVMQRAELFNGRRIVAIATDDSTEASSEVKHYLRDFTDEFIVLPNVRKLREVVTFVPMLERLESTNDNEVTFSCHAKGVRHNVEPDDEGSTLFRWAETMYRVCLDDWQAVRSDLTTHAMTGAFRRYGQFKTPGNHRWHYSGTFYWFRHRDVFRRNWRHVDQRFFGTESWPGLMFHPSETACLFGEDAGDLYKPETWEQWNPSPSLT